jgi:ABC-type amino acid transport substrate-binding protein
MGKKLVIKDFTDFDALLPAVQSGSLDMAASSITIRQDRDEVVDFSTPYYLASQGVLIGKGGRFNQDFSGMKVAYQEGTTSQSWAEEKKIAGMVFKDMNLGIQLLVVGAVDAIIMDEPAARNFAKSNPGLTFAGEIKTGEQYGLVVQQGDPKKLLPVINKVIAEMKSDGRYQKLLEKWFGGEK